MSKKIRKFANGGALSDIVGATPKFGSSTTASIGGGGGSATDGLGQVNQGSQTIGAALQRAQQSNAAASNAAQQAQSDIGGGLGPSMGIGTPLHQNDRFGLLDEGMIFRGNPAPQNYQSFGGNLKKGGTVKKYAKGGRISLEHCGVSTHIPSKKNANW